MLWPSACCFQLLCRLQEEGGTVVWSQDPRPCQPAGPGQPPFLPGPGSLQQVRSPSQVWWACLSPQPRAVRALWGRTGAWLTTQSSRAGTSEVSVAHCPPTSSLGTGAPPGPSRERLHSHGLQQGLGKVGPRQQGRCPHWVPKDGTDKRRLGSSWESWRLLSVGPAPPSPQGKVRATLSGPYKPWAPCLSNWTRSSPWVSLRLHPGAHRALESQPLAALCLALRAAAARTGTALQQWAGPRGQWPDPH